MFCVILFQVAFPPQKSNTRWLTYAKANSKPANKKDRFIRCHAQNDPPHSKNEAGQHDAFPAAVQPVQVSAP